VAGAPQDRAQTIKLAGDRLTIGSSNANDVVLDDVNVSRFHAVIEPSGDVMELRDLDSRCGTRVDGRPVKRTSLRSGAEIGIGPFRLSFDGSGFEQRNERGALTLVASGLTVRAGDATILNDVSLAIEPGELVAVIGESGSGKSTLLKGLAGVSRPDRGTATLNGEPVTARQTDTGYVPQDDIVHGLLTVREALRYAAKLRLPADADSRAVERVIERVMAEVELEDRADTRIGRLSGGQRKRASVASELVNRPSLLFLDEPTTGLDPRLEAQLMDLFRRLAEPGARAVVLVTHATVSLDLCDKLVVLGRGGELAFFGTPEEAKRFFDVDTYERIYHRLDERPATDWRREFEATRTVAPAAAPVQEEPPEPGPAGSPRAKQGSLGQLSVLLQRYARLFVRDGRNLAILFGQVPVIAIATGLLFKSGVFDTPTFAEPRAFGRPGDGIQLLFILVTTAIWFGALDGSREIVKERAVSRRESAIGVGWGAYLASKALLLAGVAAVQTVLLALIVFTIRPLEQGLPDYLALIGLLVLTSFAAVGMGLAISAAVRTEDQATSFIPLALIPQLLFAGAIVPVERMGGVIETLSNAVFGRWALAGTGSVAEIEERFAANPALARLNEYGGSFFDLAAGRAAGILLFFAACFLALAWLLLWRSRA
jgi:ABC-type multidrug transport system ATPase subunit/ABC-type multidrug transport system permease subunit